MRKEPYTTGSIVHVIKRGARGINITRDEHDEWRFLKLLYYLNDVNHSEYWEREIQRIGPGLHFKRPDSWGKREPVVNVLSYCLMPNHFHLLLEEIQEDGISKFMQSLCGSMSMHFNNKYNEKGSLFQGPFKSKTIDSDLYLDLVHIYVNVKNPFELYKRGIKNAIKDFDRAYKWASSYDFCSLGDYSGIRKNSPILARKEQYSYTSEEYKKLAKVFLLEKLDKMISNEELE